MLLWRWPVFVLSGHPSPKTTLGNGRDSNWTSWEYPEISWVCFHPETSIWLMIFLTIFGNNRSSDLMESTNGDDDASRFGTSFLWSWSSVTSEHSGISSGSSQLDHQTVCFSQRLAESNVAFVREKHHNVPGLHFRWHLFYISQNLQTLCGSPPRSLIPPPPPDRATLATAESISESLKYCAAHIWSTVLYRPRQKCGFRLSWVLRLFLSPTFNHGQPISAQLVSTDSTVSSVSSVLLTCSSLSVCPMTTRQNHGKKIALHVWESRAFK